MSPSQPLKLAVFVSGSGSNLQALLELEASEPLVCQIVAVIASNDHCYALTRAKQAKVPTHVIKGKDFAKPAAYDAEVYAILDQYTPDYLCLAGFMRLLSQEFVDKWHNKIINIHPSLLPAFKGLHAIEQAVEAGALLLGCTVHLVRHEMDAGPILVQAALNRIPDEDLESLKSRIHALEHQCYKKAICAIASGTVEIDGDMAIWHRKPQANSIFSC